MAFSRGPKMVTDGLVLCLDAGNPKSYPGVGTTWSDLSGNSNNGTLTNGPTFDSGNGGSISFDGVDDYCKTPSSSDFLFSSGDSITLENWIKCSDIQSQTYQAFFTIGGSTSVTRDRMIQMRVSQYTQYGYVDILHRNSSNTSWHILRTSNTIVSNNQWIYIVGSLTYGNGSTWKIYSNGVQQSTTFHAGNGNEAPLQPSDTSTYIGIGEDGTGEAFKGFVSYSKLYNKALTSSEIQQNYNATKGRFGL